MTTYGEPIPKAHAFVVLTRVFDTPLRSLTARDVAWRFEVSLRTAERWLAELETLIPLESSAINATAPRVWRKTGGEE